MLFRIDAEKGEGKELAGLWKVKAYPSFIVFNSQGAPLNRWIGYSKSFFLDVSKDALSDKITLDEKITKMKTEPNSVIAASLGRWNAASGEVKIAVDYYIQAQTLNKDSMLDYSYDIFDNIAKGAKDSLYKFDDIRNAADKVLISKTSTDWRKMEVALRMSDISRQNNQNEFMTDYIRAGLDLPVDSSKESMESARNKLLLNQALYVSGDTAKAMVLKRSSMPKDWINDSGNLNNFCWWCFENKANLAEAETLSKKSVELAKPGNEKAMCLDTYAEIANARGNPKLAVELTRQAIAQDSTSDYYPKQLNRFEGLVNFKKP